MLGSKVFEGGRICTGRHNGKQENNDKVSFSQFREAGDSPDRLERCHHPIEAGRMDNIPRLHFQRAKTY